MNTTTLYDLNHSKCIIAFSGADAATFLQGQTTCDILSLDEKKNTFGAICNSKGRALILFHLFKIKKSYHMILSSDMCDSTIKRLKMFVFRSKVTIEDVSSNYSIYAVNGPTLSSIKPLTVINYQEGGNLAILLFAKENSKELNDSSTITINADCTEWQQLLVTACIPEITNTVSELFIPQMLNLDALGGISFQKGCYTGQEIISRMHYKGTVKRRLVGYQSTTLHAAGEEIHTAEDASSIGTVLNCVATVNDSYTGLLVLKVSHIKETLTLKDGSPLSILKQPYNLD